MKNTLKSTEARRAMVVQHLPLARKIARKIAAALPSSIRVHIREDLEQEARVGLMAAAERFDPARGVEFGAYAWSGPVRGAVVDFLRRWDWLSRESRQRIKAGARADTSAPVSLADHVYPMGHPEHGLRWIDTLVSPYFLPDEDLRKRELYEAIWALPQRERMVIAAMYFADHSTGEIAKAMGYATVTVRRLHRKAIHRMHVAMTRGEGGPDDEAAGSVAA